jgi:hypothetical protein
MQSISSSTPKMPIVQLHLLSLHASTTLLSFLHTLHSYTPPLNPQVTSRVLRWIILPTTLSTNLPSPTTPWHLLLILPTTSPLPPSLQQKINHQWTIQAGIPRRLLEDFQRKNAELLHPRPEDVPPLTGSLDNPRIASSSQGLEFSPELRSWIEEFGRTEEGNSAVSMLNLLAFNPGLKDQYLTYGSEFAKSIGSKRGGFAKIVGTVIHGEGNEDGEGWDEVALAHYPSIWHFADMLASEDYQAVNQRYRVPSLRDTFILCTSEVGLDGVVGRGAKL